MCIVKAVKLCILAYLQQQCLGGKNWLSVRDFLLILNIVFFNVVSAVNYTVFKQLWRPLDLVIHLHPAYSGPANDFTAFVSIDLHITCSDDYPLKSAPKVFLENPKGLSDGDVKKLNCILTKKSDEMLGSEVVLELCQIVEDFLSKNNKPPEGSFHDGMLREKAAAEHEIKKQKATTEQREREEIAAFQEIRREKLLWKEAENYERTSNRHLSIFSSELLCCIDGVERRICPSSSSGPRALSNNIYKEYSAHVFDTGSEVLVTEWRFIYSLGRRGALRKADFRVQPFLEKLSALEDQMLRLTKWKVASQNLCSYSFFSVLKNSVSPTKVDVRILLAQSVGSGDTVLSRCATDLLFRPTVLSKLAAQTLLALKSLHCQQLLHSNLSPDTIWVTTNESFQTSDYYLIPFIEEVREAFESGAGKDDLSTKRSFSRKDDILQLRNLLQAYSSKLSDGKFKDSLYSFLLACASAESIEELVDHPFLLCVESPSFAASMLNNEGINFDGSNRLKNEFVYLDFLGKGGFGDVVLARNKLDGNDYAIKRIPLDPRDEKLNRKVMREAKLFSGLCHTNVVRYFSAWIEHVPKPSSPSRSTTAEKAEEGERQSSCENSMLPANLRNIESRVADIPVESAAEWSTSFHKLDVHSSSSTSGSDDEELPFFKKNHSSNVISTTNNSDFEILFEENEVREAVGEISERELAESDEKSRGTDSASSLDLGFRVLYIQMEYCEQSTLRSLIDSGELSAIPRRIWQILKQILLGLQYIHQEGMIHRDIKPMNILIDGTGTAKIGDFGLATRNYLERQSACTISSEKEESLTKDIGTALYIAPELLSTSGLKVDYTAKIDVYSVGIVLFEMFYRPLLPGMERISILKTLRNCFFFPDDFATEVPEVHRKTAKDLIKLMLTLSPDERPSVRDVLESERIPLIELEESEFQKIFSQTYRSRNSKLRQWMLDTMFSEPVPQAVDFLYDQFICLPKNSLGIPAVRAMDMIEQQLSKICLNHAFVKFPAHSIVPSRLSPSAVSRMKECKFIDDCGTSVSLPFDLRRAFVRYCVRNGINRLKRFHSGKVYGYTDELAGTHPAERSEFSVDYLGPHSSSPLLDAEILIITLEAVSCIELFQSFKWELKVGHLSLIAAAATYLGYSDSSAQMKILNALHKISSSEELLNKKQRIDRLQTCAEMSQNQATSLLSILEGDEFTMNALRERFRPLLRSRNDMVREFAKKGLDDLTSCCGILETFSDMTDRVIFDSSLCCRPSTFSNGLVFQLTILYPRKRGGMRPVVICYGGHYEGMLEQERRGRDPAPPTPTCLVGCGFIMDSLAKLHCARFPGFGKSLCSALVCSVSSELIMEEVCLVRLLWENNISADILYDPVSSVHELGLLEHCSEKEIGNILIVTDRNEVFLRSHNTDYGKLSFSDAVAKIDSAGENGTVSSCEIMARSRQATNSSSVATAANISIHFATSEKLAYNTRKRIEVQVPLFMQKTLANFSSSARIEVVVCDLPSDAVRQLVAAIDRNLSLEELHVVFDNLSLQLNKYKKGLKFIHETLENAVLFGRQTWLKAIFRFFGVLSKSIFAPIDFPEGTTKSVIGDGRGRRLAVRGERELQSTRGWELHCGPVQVVSTGDDNDGASDDDVGHHCSIHFAAYNK
ncbi:unnamed protein product [Enterobius vermicularis]|uniref:non-specific serine/threonine protein kinase n=1 Tax=Enterobius vermicularis TaxID=51028 RepID=A0A0N4VGZ0_ENTVE|nr:unnamed protein product [Enterobius vermicularis]